MSILRNFAAFSYPICGFNAVTSINERFTFSLITSSSASIPTAQLSLNETIASANK